MLDQKIYYQKPRRAVPLGRSAAALLLLTGLLLFLWQAGFGSPNDPGGGSVQPWTSADGSVWPAQLSADKEGVARWQEYQTELAAAAAEVKVAVYCTHSSESYTAYSGEAKVYGEKGGVYLGAAALADALIAGGVGTVVDETIHDWPDWNDSYGNSLATAEGLLDSYPNLQLLIDMHRDAGVSREQSYTMINGRAAARIMLVCGSDQRYTHPNWRVNQQLMQRIADKMEEMYPGLLRRVSVQAGRYNQHIFDHAILVEMGTTENTIEEVEYSSRLLGEVLLVVLDEENAA